MANLYIELPDPLVEQAHEAGISIPLVLETALQARLTERPAGSSAVTSDSCRDSDVGRYRAGFSLGVLWARGAATPSEILEITEWRGRRWSHFSVDVTTNSLPAVYCESRGDEPPTSGRYAFERDAYTEGILDGAASVLKRAMGVAGTAG